MLLAHELTHALQDQNFNLEASLDKVKNDDDRALALKSVAEGDATSPALRMRLEGSTTRRPACWLRSQGSSEIACGRGAGCSASA